MSEVKDKLATLESLKVTNDTLNEKMEEKAAEAVTKIYAHNTGTDTHSDIRMLINGLTDRFDAMNIPTSTTADNGKVLSVVDGVPSWAITSSEQAAISAANAEQSAIIAQECAQAMAGTFDFTGYLRYQVVDVVPEACEDGVLYLVTSS